ncbi:MAG TPA: hypothetical protein VFQ38_04205 [Longimicrobiales bacterium]|nr:hypothetical protein [Longimicrobiales bacterium]
MDVYAVRCQTVDVNGRGTLPSGAVVLPTGAPAVPLVSYSHGTVTQEADVPSNPQNVELLGAGILNGSQGGQAAMALVREIEQHAADETVPPRNTLTAAARMQEVGANVEVVDLGPLGHADAAIPAFVAARSWLTPS